MPEKNEWVKFTLRLRPETVYLMHKYCKEPTRVLRKLTETWVASLVEKGLKEELEITKAGENIKW